MDCIIFSNNKITLPVSSSWWLILFLCRSAIYTLYVVDENIVVTGDDDGRIKVESSLVQNHWWFIVHWLPPTTKLGQGYIFTGVCDSVHRGRGMHGCRGVCMVAGGCAWLPGACMVAGGCGCGGGMHGCQGGMRGCRGSMHCWGGMHGCQGVCMVVGGMCGCWGHAWLLGACVVTRGACMGYDEIRSMSGRYASYWNAFLFIVYWLHWYDTNRLVCLIKYIPKNLEVIPAIQRNTPAKWK